MSGISVFGVSNPSVTILDAGRYCASFALKKQVRVKATKSDSGVAADGVFKNIMEEAASNAMEFLGHEIGVELGLEECDGGMPGASEAVACATVQAVAGLIAKRYGSISVLKIDQNLSRQFFIVDEKIIPLEGLLKASLAGENSFARTASSFYGGYVICDGGEIARRGEMEECFAGVAITSKEIGIEFNDEDELYPVWQAARRGEVYTAGRDFALICANDYSKKILGEMVSKDAIALTLDDGLITAWRRDDASTLTEAGEKFGEVSNINISNELSFVDEPSRSVWKMNKFTGYPGSKEFGMI
ncbi:MAG TPA: hypothetical protein ENN13_04905 [Candidatus Altiarchaeales archaeon]|nr:hypothetical protein [Candidatus Altiarchaeales archaeon]